MNPTQKQFSLNRGASRKQIPISRQRDFRPFPCGEQWSHGKTHASLQHPPNVEISLAHLLQVLSVNAFSQVALAELVANTQTQEEPEDSHNQLLLW